MRQTGGGTMSVSINGSAIGTDYGNKVTVNFTSNSSSNTPNPTNSSTQSTNTTDSSSTTPSFSDLTQIIFKLLPPKCCDFTVTPTLACSGCEKGYSLTANNTCEQTPIPTPTTSPLSNSSSNKSVPVQLKVTASLPSTSGASLPIVVTQPLPSVVTPSPAPQPIFVPISSPPTPSSSGPACPPNLSFDARQPVMGVNCPCLCF